MLLPPTETPSAPITASTTNNGSSINLKWYPAKDAWYYEIEISTDSLFYDIVDKINNIKALEYSIKNINNPSFFGG
ncbi:MAG: hypothetical protein MZV64_00595 [Ignavibacteriales bacterium]|nr:hypothetical protein [Ignavibacteriales bacterium]